MRLASFSTAQLPTPHLGLVKDDEIVDVDLAARALGFIVPDQMNEFIDRYTQSEPALQAILDKAAGRRLSEVKTFSQIGAAHSLASVQIAAPIPRPRKNIMCLGLNYVEHAKESDEARGRSPNLPQYPVIFTKAPTCMNSAYGAIVIDPKVSEQIDWEVELAMVIGKGGKNIRQEDALSHVFGYSVLNDVSARDLQDRHRQFFKGKSIDGYCPMGPWIVTADEVPDPQQLRLSLRVNGVTKQESNTSMMIFSVAQIIATLSLGMTLEPGDIIATGTPSGVGFARKPPEFLKAGDVMETEVEGIGVMRNKIVSE